MDMDEAFEMARAGWAVRRPSWSPDLCVRRHATHPHRYAGPMPTEDDIRAEDWETAGRVQ